MPLLFKTEDRRSIAFGFFNIETDMLLLESHFFFASDFCRAIRAVAESDPRDFFEISWDTYDVPYRKIGDLHGAIAGVRLTGFIGEVYRTFPFPRLPENFKQNPEGFQSRPMVEEIAGKYAAKRRLLMKVSAADRRVIIGEYPFTYEGFHALLVYVWEGGYPRWKEARRPPYVLELKRAIEKSRWPLFEGLNLNRGGGAQ